MHTPYKQCVNVYKDEYYRELLLKGHYTFYYLPANHVGYYIMNVLVYVVSVGAN